MLQRLSLFVSRGGWKSGSDIHRTMVERLTMVWALYQKLL